MATRIAVLFISLLVIPIVLAEEPAPESDAIPQNSGEESLLFADPEKYSGDWREKNGIRECDGYLTHSEDEDYCAAEIPDDWRKLEFNGKTYFIQPLT